MSYTMNLMNWELKQQKQGGIAEHNTTGSLTNESQPGAVYLLSSQPAGHCVLPMRLAQEQTQSPVIKSFYKAVGKKSEFKWLQRKMWSADERVSQKRSGKQTLAASAHQRLKWHSHTLLSGSGKHWRGRTIFMLKYNVNIEQMGVNWSFINLDW